MLVLFLKLDNFVCHSDLFFGSSVFLVIFLLFSVCVLNNQSSWRTPAPSFCVCLNHRPPVVAEQTACSFISRLLLSRRLNFTLNWEWGIARANQTVWDLPPSVHPRHQSQGFICLMLQTSYYFFTVTSLQVRGKCKNLYASRQLNMTHNHNQHPVFKKH